MTNNGKAGLKVLGITFVTLVAGLSFCVYVGPGKVDRDVAWLTRSDVSRAALREAETLHQVLKDGDYLRGDDERSVPLQKATAPVRFSYIQRVDNSLHIYYGGGFYHFGYRLDENAGRYRLVLEEDEKEDRELLGWEERGRSIQ